jgi:hypothetical protein
MNEMDPVRTFEINPPGNTHSEVNCRHRRSPTSRFRSFRDDADMKWCQCQYACMYVAYYTFVDQTILKQNSEPKEDFRCMVEVGNVLVPYMYSVVECFIWEGTTYRTTDVFDSKNEILIGQVLSLADKRFEDGTESRIF